MSDKLHLLIVIQTHSLGNRDTTKERFVNASKAEVMKRCLSSLIDAIYYAQNKLDFLEMNIAVLDDHSDPDSLSWLRSHFPNVISLETKGIMPSILACYEYGKEHGKQLVYFVQDDYLYYENALEQMVKTWIQTTTNLQKSTAIFPYNDPYHYIPVNTAIKSHVIQGEDRYWRSWTMTASCFMTHIKVIQDNWDLFYNMGTHPISSVMERDTINRLFTQRGYHLFIPIPSLALHMQFDTEIDPFLDWKLLWEKYK